MVVPSALLHGIACATVEKMAMKWQLSSSVHRILTFGVLGGREQFEVVALYPASACRKKVTVEVSWIFFKTMLNQV